MTTSKDLKKSANYRNRIFQDKPIPKRWFQTINQKETLQMEIRFAPSIVDVIKKIQMYDMVRRRVANMCLSS